MEQKECYTCKEPKDLTEFHKTSSNEDGLNINCIVCRKEKRGVYYSNNKDHINKKRRENTKLKQVKKFGAYSYRHSENDYSTKGEWKELKETNLYKQLMNGRN